MRRLNRWRLDLRRSGLVFILAVWSWVLPACNYPGVVPPAHELTGAELRQTLEVQGRLPLPVASPSLLPTVGMPPMATSGYLPATLPAPSGTALAMLATLTPAPAPPVGGIIGEDGAFWLYRSQAGDTLPALAARFGVAVDAIRSLESLPAQALLSPGQELRIPKLQLDAAYEQIVLPDSEVIDSPTAAGFDTAAFIQQAGGYLSEYHEQSGGQWLSGAQVVERVARESSVNPRLLLALIELRSGWVRGNPAGAAYEKYPLGFHVSGWEGLYKELVIAATHLNAGYYGWRSGAMLEMSFSDGTRQRLHPGLNAGSAGVQSLLAYLYRPANWQAAIYGPNGLLDIERQLFGDPWQARNWPVFPAGIAQPALELPFAPGLRWSLTGGPHEAWKTGSPRGALDFAPVTGEARCAVSSAWATAPADGVVVRSDRNVLALDLDGDGYEQTGWVIIFLHLADAERAPAGARLRTNDRLGHPSCEGGASTGTHMHVARKYNGEWIAADGLLPFILGGWQAFASAQDYQGGLRNGSQEVVASPVGPRTSIITR